MVARSRASKIQFSEKKKSTHLYDGSFTFLQSLNYLLQLIFGNFTQNNLITFTKCLDLRLQYQKSERPMSC